jgi:hypothetical protein
MGKWPKIVEAFPLTVTNIVREYTLLPSDASGTFYHYTNRAGLEGILRDGGFRAGHRLGMNDPGEFRYARDLIYEELIRLGKSDILPKVAESLTTYTRKNLDTLLQNTTEVSSAYCACFTASPDDTHQWDTYAANGHGFAIGIDLLQFLRTQIPAVRQRQPYVFCGPVTYAEEKQRDLVGRLVKAAISDLQTFASTRTQTPEQLTALRDRVTQEVVVHIISLIDFIKAPSYSRERELRLFMDPNDGTFNAPNLQYYERNNKMIPYIFVDLRNPTTGRLPLAEIMVGPNGPFSEREAYLTQLLNELWYGEGCADCPRITRSSNRHGA